MKNDDSDFLKILELTNSYSGPLLSIDSIKQLFEERLEELGVSQHQVEKMLSMQRKTLESILDNTCKKIDFVNIIKLGHFVGLSIDEVVKLYIPELSSDRIAEIQKAKESGYIYAQFEVEALIKANFFNKREKLFSSNKIEYLKKRITTFFGLKTIYSYSEDRNLNPAFSRAKKTSNDKVRDFWVISAYYQFKELANPNPYDRDKLKDLLQRIRPYTRNEKEGITTVSKALYSVGVTVIFQPSIINLQVKGATLAVNGKPCIVLSNLNKKYPTLWHVLLHELHHVLYDFDNILLYKFHLTGEPDLFLPDEEAADRFAQEYLLSTDRLNFISTYINSQRIVEKYAAEWSIHPAIIYARYCYEYNKWGHPVSSQIPSNEQALKYLNTNPFEREKLIESVEQLKKLVYNI